MIVLDDRTSWNISMEILRPLCAPHAPPPIWIGTPEVTSTRGVIPRFSIRHVYAVALDGWMDIFQGNENLRRLREIFFSFRFFFFLLWERIVIGWNEWMRVRWKGDVGFDWFPREILLLYYKVYECWTIGLLKLFEIFIREMCVWYGRMSIAIEEMLEFIKIKSQNFK